MRNINLETTALICFLDSSVRLTVDVTDQANPIP